MVNVKLFTKYVFLQWCKKGLCCKNNTIFRVYLHLHSISGAFLSEPQSSRCITALWEFHQNWMQLYICILAVWEGGSHVYNKYKELWYSFSSLRTGQAAWIVLIGFFMKILCETKLQTLLWSEVSNEGT